MYRNYPRMLVEMVLDQSHALLLVDERRESIVKENQFH